MAILPTAHSTIGKDPDTSILGLQKSAHVVVANMVVVRHSAVAPEPVGATSHGSEPQGSAAITEHCPDGDTVQSWERVGRHCIMIDAKQMRGTDPDGSICISKDCTEIRIRNIRKGQHPHTRATQTQQPCLCSNPHILFSVIEDTENGIARQHGGRRQMQEAVLILHIEAISYGSDPQSSLRAFPHGADAAAHCLYLLKFAILRSSVQAPGCANPDGSARGFAQGFDTQRSRLFRHGVFAVTASLIADQSTASNPD